MSSVASSATSTEGPAPATAGACADARRESSALSGSWKHLLVGLIIFGVFFALPVGWQRFDQSVGEALALTRWYAQEHVLLCLVPAFFIAGAIAVFLGRSAVIRYLGPTASKPVAYGVASVSGALLAVCSCTVLPLFAGIRRMGAGLGPATTFLYSGPAVNVLAIVLTAAVLGPALGAARAIGAVSLSIVIGLVMHVIYHKEESQRAADAAAFDGEHDGRPVWQTAIHFAAMVGILVFANWGKPQEDTGLWHAIWSSKWIITSGFAALLGVVLIMWYGVRWWKAGLVGFATLATWALSAYWFVPTYGAHLPGHDRGLPYAAMIPFAVATVGLSLALSVGRRSDESSAWFDKTWGFARQITPLLFFGVLVAGFLLGRPGEEGMIPSAWIGSLVGGNSLGANLLASVLGALMYFATLTEVPILQGLIGSGMGKGPALALLLAGPALSLPNMLVIRSVLDTQKTIVFVSLVVVTSTLTGWAYGIFF